MFKTVLIATAAVASLSATPSLATPINSAAATLEGAPTTASTAPAKTPQRNANTRYCVIETPTGSHLEHKTCHTRQDWIDLTGVDPLHAD